MIFSTIALLQVEQILAGESFQGPGEQFVLIDQAGLFNPALRAPATMAYDKASNPSLGDLVQEPTLTVRALQRARRKDRAPRSFHFLNCAAESHLSGHHRQNATVVTQKVVPSSDVIRDAGTSLEEP